MLYPLSYEGGGCRKRGRKPDVMVGFGQYLLHLDAELRSSVSRR